MEILVEAIHHTEEEEEATVDINSHHHLQCHNMAIINPVLHSMVHKDPMINTAEIKCHPIQVIHRHHNNNMHHTIPTVMVMEIITNQDHHHHNNNNNNMEVEMHDALKLKLKVSF